MNIKNKYLNSRKVLITLMAVSALVFSVVALVPDASAQPQNQVAQQQTNTLFGPQGGKYQCGHGKNEVKTRFNFGCLGDKAPNPTSAIEDLLYAIIRFLSAGVGLVVVLAIVLSGIQYSTSEGNPETTQQAKNRIRNAIIGLFIYLFAFALVQWLVPGGLFAVSLPTPETLLISTGEITR
jgi:hypothetical protein